MRRRSKSASFYPPATSSINVAPNRRSLKPFDMRKAKRVRFADGEIDGEANQSPDAPKTSEFAYFKKVKNGVVHSHSRSRRKENESFKSSETNDLVRETSSAFGTLKPRTKDLKFSVPGERAWPSDHSIFQSTTVSRYDEPDQRKLIDKCEKGLSLLNENVTPVDQRSLPLPFFESSETSENEFIEEDIFSAKRHRLREWATQTLFSEVEKPHSKGFDFVSALMSRLFPEDNGDNNDSSKGDADNCNRSLTLHKSNNLEKGLMSHKRHLNKDIPKISSEIIPSDWDTFVSRFPFPNYGTECHVQNHLDQHSKTHIYRSSHTQHDFSFCSPFERYRSSDSFRFKGLDELGYITDPPRVEPYRSLLEWDVEFEKDKMDSSIFNHDAKTHAFSEVSTSWNVGQNRIIDNVLNSKGLCSNYFLEFDSLPNTRDFEPDFDDVKFAMTEPGQPCLALPYAPKFITGAEDRNQENIISNHDVIFSYRDQRWLNNKVWEDKPHRDILQRCLSPADFAAEDYRSIFHAWQFPQNESILNSLSRQKESHGEFFTPLSEGAFYPNFFSLNQKDSLGTLINRPLLLDHVSRGRSDQELYYVDDDNELEHRYML